MLIASIQQSK